MKKLTETMLLEMNPGEIFAEGFCKIKHPWFNDAKKTVDENGMTTVKYVAVRGKGMHDWCVYHSLDANFEHAPYLDGDDHLRVSSEAIAQMGAKMHPEDAFKLFKIEDEKVKDLYMF